VLTDHRPKGGDDPIRAGAELFHCGDAGLDYPGERSSPSGMRRADHPRHGICKKYWTAISRRYADGETKRARNDCIGAWACLSCPRRVDDRNVG
jgi:hypothetical protein